MRVTVVRPGDLGPGEASLWARFQKSSPELHNPFFSLTFAQVVDRHRPNARVAVVEDDGAIQAFLPLTWVRIGIGMPIGDPMNNLQGFISEGANRRREAGHPQVRLAGLAVHGRSRGAGCPGGIPLRRDARRGTNHRSQRRI